MVRVIDKVAAIVHYVDGRTEDGYFKTPLRPGGQYQTQFVSLMKKEGIETFINLNHVINIEQSILFKEVEESQNSGLKPQDFATKRAFI